MAPAMSKSFFIISPSVRLLNWFAAHRFPSSGPNLYAWRSLDASAYETSHVASNETL
jgi:hypothetical protein